MAVKKDWYPTKRAQQLAMGNTWVSTITEAKAVLWKIPFNLITELAALVTTAEALYAQTLGNERTKSITARCKKAFSDLAEKMRDMKKRYFLKPPLTNADFVDLMLPVPDDTKSKVPDPVDHPGIEITKWAPHSLGFRVFKEVSQGDDRSDYGVRIYYGLVRQGAVSTGERPSATRFAGDVYLLSSLPLTEADLPNSFFTRSANGVLELPPEASGMTIYIASRYENDKGKAGPWGKMTSTVVP
jgi:hypothetical protein